MYEPGCNSSCSEKWNGVSSVLEGLGKKENEDEKVSKIEFSKQMLEDIRKCFNGRLWVAMDRWFICKEFFQWLIGNNYDWVTKAKRNTALYRLEYERITGRERYVPIKPVQIIKDNFIKLLKSGKVVTLSAIAIPGIYMKLPYEVVNKKGKMTTKWKYTSIAAVAAMRFAEDTITTEDELVEVKEEPAT